MSKDMNAIPKLPGKGNMLSENDIKLRMKDLDAAMKVLEYNGRD